MARIKVFRIPHHQLIGAILPLLEKSRCLRANSHIEDVNWNWRTQSLDLIISDSKFKIVDDGMEAPIEIVGRK